ncbi:MAG: dephospho-CoA kinase [Clostridiales Family XIII bacterium]|jgi:dephospho-CoA kinase|nr:dephospho-CoA kinase [Clostridiales Family XIII bacterium]
MTSNNTGNPPIGANAGLSAPDKQLRVIGITGGIGSGKSTVTAHLRRRLYSVYDADEIAREAVRPGEPALKELTAAFGEDILNADGTLNRSALADKVFGDESKVEVLNAILHGDIARRLDAHIDRHRAHVLKSRGKMKTLKTAFIDAPLLFESGLAARCDETWLIIADEDIRLRRVALRDGLSEAQIRARAAHQLSDAEKRKRADIVIENNGSVEELIKQIDARIISQG